MSLEQKEKEIFRDILLKKPSWQGLAGSELEDIITTYVGQRAEATLFEIERAYQENFLQLASGRESIMARAEAEGYVPVPPKPLLMEVKIVNEGPDPVPLGPLLDASRPLELITDDGTELVLGDRLISLDGPEGEEFGAEENTTQNNGAWNAEQHAENHSGVEPPPEPENTVTKISSDKVETTGGYVLKLMKFASPPDPKPLGYKFTNYALKLDSVEKESDIRSEKYIEDESPGAVVIARVSPIDKNGEIFCFRIFNASGETLLSVMENDLPAARSEITELKNSLDNYWERRADFPLDIAAEDKNAILSKTLDITDCLCSLIIYKDNAGLHFHVFDKEGKAILTKAESDLVNKDADLNNLKNTLSCFELWSGVEDGGELAVLDAEEKSQIISAAIRVADCEYKRVVLTGTEIETTSDSYPSGKIVETRRVTTTAVRVKTSMSGDISSLPEETEASAVKTTTEPLTDENGEIFIMETVVSTDLQTGSSRKIETVKKGEEKTRVSCSVAETDPEAGITTETATQYETDGETVKNLTVTITNINTKTVETLFEELGLTTRTFIQKWPDIGKIEKSAETIKENGDFTKEVDVSQNGTVRSAIIRPEGPVNPDDGEIKEKDGLIFQGDNETPLNGETTVKIIRPDSGKTTTVTVVVNNAGTTTTNVEADPVAGCVKTVTVNELGARTEKVEFDALSPGCSATVVARQLWKEVKSCNTSPEQGKSFQEFIVGGADENGDFTIHDFEVEINGEKWIKEQNFLNGGPESQIYHVYHRLSDESAFRLGDGEVGKIPPPGSGVKITVWRTLGDRAFIAPGTEISPLLDAEEPLLLTDVQGEIASLSFVGGRVLERGLPLEHAESIRKNALSHIQVGGVVARRVDYEYKIHRRFPDLLYLKVWGEKEQIAHDQYNPEYINKAFFTFLIEREEEEADADHRHRTDRVRVEIEEYFNTLIKPMNVEPSHKPLQLYRFGVKITGVVDRVYLDISAVENEIKELLTIIFGSHRSERNFLRKFGYSDKRDKFMKLFQRCLKLNGRLKDSDIYDALRESGYFRDAQPHLNRRERPYFEVELTYLDVPPSKDFFDQYIYLDADKIDFEGNKDSEYPGLGYADNF